MRKRYPVAVILLLAGAGLWLGIRGPRSVESGIIARTLNESRASIPSEASPASGRLKTKASNREPSGPHATHAPERLKEFMLPEIAIDGLTLGEALRKLMAAYQDACLKSGETPLPLVFTVPAAATRKLTLHLPAGNFNASVQLLATLSGMKASRKDREYRFEPLTGERKQVSQELPVPPDFNTTLNVMAGVETAIEPGDPFARQEPIVRKTEIECLTALGLDLDPSTHVSLGASGKLTLKTTSAADAAAISELAKSLSEHPPMQTKFTSKILELPSGADWTPPNGSRMRDDEVQMLMREMSQTKGVELQTTPTVTARNGQNATVEIIREVIYPTDDTGKNFETRNVGKVLNLQGSLLGFGHEVATTFTDTTGGLDPSTGKAAFDKRTDMADTGFSSDGGSRFIVQTRPDGSRTVLLLNSTMIDATGRPIHDQD